MATLRPKRSVPKRDYKKMTSITIPRTKSRRTATSSTNQDAQSSSKRDNQLYRLKILEEDPSRGMVKVRYVGYGNECDEWRAMDDIVDLTEDDSNVEQDGVEGSFHFDLYTTLEIPQRKRYCLYEELTYRIKSLLVSSRKGDPVCCVTMNFDAIYFESLAIRCTLIKNPKQGNQKCYTLSAFSKLTDLLGPRWYIRGINVAGDFCYVQPGTVKFHLRRCRGKCDYQLLDTGRLEKCYFGKTDQLVFHFLRGDGTSAQWYI